MLAKIEVRASKVEEWEKRQRELQEASSLGEMVYGVLRLLWILGQSLLEQELGRRVQEGQGKPELVCQSCGSRLESKGQRQRQMMTLVGKVY